MSVERELCGFRAAATPKRFPRRAQKREGELRRGAAFVVRRADGFILLRTRPAKGLLGGMTEVPTTEWSKDFAASEALDHAPRLRQPIVWRRTAGVVRHVFTHFPLELTVYMSEVPARTAAPQGDAVDRDCRA